MHRKKWIRLATLVALPALLVALLPWPGCQPSEDSLEISKALRGATRQEPTIPSSPYLTPEGDRRRGASGETAAASSDGREAELPSSVRFVGPEGRPVVAVTVFDRGQQPPRILSESGDDGLASLPAELMSSTALAAVHPDYLIAEFSPSRSGESPQIVVLDPGSSIQGTVRFADGSVEFDSVQVLAAPFGRLPSASQVETALKTGADPTGALRVGQSDAAGRFMIRGLIADRQYYVTAAGSQCLAGSGLEGVEPSEGPVELELDWLHGVRVRLIEADRSLQVSSTVRHARGVQMTLHGLLPPHRTWEAALAWIPAADLGLGSKHQTLHLAVGGTRAEHGESMKLDASVPGYERVTRYIELQPAAHHVPVEDVVLTPRGSGWSTLVVEIGGAPREPSEVPETQRSAGTLILAQAGEPQFEVLLHDLAAGASSRHVVPSGHFEATFLSNAGRYLWPRPPDTVSIDLTLEEGHISLPLEDCGGLELSLTSRDGDSLEDRAIIRLSHEDTSGYTHTRFMRPPYSFDALPPGKYRVAAIVGPAFLPPGKEAYQGEVEVQARERSMLNLREE